MPGRLRALRGGGRHDHAAHHHAHGPVDPAILRSRAGVAAVSLSLAVLLITALVQLCVYLVSDSVALLTDVLHNDGDALTAVPLGCAFLLRSARAERWSGYIVVGVILTSALVALWQVVERLLRPEVPTHLGALLVAGVVGVVGNETAARIRWRAGRRLHSPALIADGHHARSDSVVSAGVVVSAAFVAAGLPIADPIVGLIITGLILRASWQSWLALRAGQHDHATQMQ